MNKLIALLIFAIILSGCTIPEMKNTQKTADSTPTIKETQENKENQETTENTLNEDTTEIEKELTEKTQESTFSEVYFLITDIPVANLDEYDSIIIEIGEISIKKQNESGIEWITLELDTNTYDLLKLTKSFEKLGKLTLKKENYTSYRIFISKLTAIKDENEYEAIIPATALNFEIEFTPNEDEIIFLIDFVLKDSFSIVNDRLLFEPRIITEIRENSNEKIKENEISSLDTSKFTPTFNMNSRFKDTGNNFESKWVTEKRFQQLIKEFDVDAISEINFKDNNVVLFSSNSDNNVIVINADSKEGGLASQSYTESETINDAIEEIIEEETKPIETIECTLHNECLGKEYCFDGSCRLAKIGEVTSITLTVQDDYNNPLPSAKVEFDAVKENTQYLRDGELYFNYVITGKSKLTVSKGSISETRNLDLNSSKAPTIKIILNELQCNKLAGQICPESKTCSIDFITAHDSNRCCQGVCVAS